MKTPKHIFSESELERAALGSTGRTSVQLKDGQRLVKRVGYRIPDDFVGIQVIKVYGRKWWQFWLPKELYLYNVIKQTTP